MDSRRCPLERLHTAQPDDSGSRQEWTERMSLTHRRVRCTGCGRPEIWRPYPALSITRPWSDLILRHGKDVENRSWPTSYRGRMWIHAAKSWQSTAFDVAEEILGVDLPRHRDAYPTGIVGMVELVGTCEKARQGRILRDACICGDWAAYGQYHFRLANPRPLAEPVPCGGALGLWTPTDEVLDAVRHQLEVADAV